jgi:hypothetical protein
MIFISQNGINLIERIRVHSESLADKFVDAFEVAHFDRRKVAEVMTMMADALVELERDDAA